MPTVPGPQLKENEEGVPILYERALLLYDYMLENLEQGLYEDNYQMYRGRITDEMESEFGMTPSQYSRAADLLKSVGAIEQVGRSNEGSEWVLYYRPTFEKFDEVREANYNKRRRKSKIVILEQRVNDLVETVAGLEFRLAVLEEKHGTD